MPQFDTFIFSSSLFYFIITFFILLYFNFTRFLPRLSAILKLRSKLTKKSSLQDNINVSYHDKYSVFGSQLTINEKA
uniref:ATP synthase subunit 8 n=1 Tax=Physarum polycephalum TaxID=5791 RepID=Q3SAU3_PHYPO|nr:ATP synthase subunit 8 [Physarum polycephalum]